MPFFDCNKFTISIDFDKPSAFIGGTVSGVVTIKCSEPATARGVVLCYKSLSEVKVEQNDDWYTGDLNDFQEKIDPTKNQFHKLDDILHEVDYLLFGSRNGEVVTINPGEYLYPFIIPIPIDLPPTCSGNGGASHDECCKCCCDCCGYEALFAAVSHFFEVRIVIAWSLMDTTLKVPLLVQSGINSHEYRNQHPCEISFTGKSASCVECCPALAPSCGLKDHSVHMWVEKQLIVVGQDTHIPIRLWGTYPYKFRVGLITKQYEPEHHDAEMYWLETAPAPKLDNLSRENATTVNLQISRKALRMMQFPTFQLNNQRSRYHYHRMPMEVEYFVTIRFEYDEGCFAGYLDDSRPLVPIKVYQGHDVSVPLSANFPRTAGYGNNPMYQPAPPPQLPPPGQNSPAMAPPPQPHPQMGASYPPPQHQQQQQQPPPAGYGYPQQQQPPPLQYPPQGQHDPNQPQPYYSQQQQQQYPPQQQGYPPQYPPQPPQQQQQAPPPQGYGDVQKPQQQPSYEQPQKPPPPQPQQQQHQGGFERAEMPAPLGTPYQPFYATPTASVYQYVPPPQFSQTFQPTSAPVSETQLPNAVWGVQMEFAPL